MKVILLDKTENPERKIAYCARLCYSNKPPDKLKEKLKEDEINRMVQMIIETNHHSVLEHVSFTFGIQNISRNATHQLVRHRLASFSQQSLRYTEIKAGENVYSNLDQDSIPDYIYSDKKLYDLYTKKLKSIEELSLKYYNELLDNDIKPEDARNVLLTSVNTNIIFTMNCRTLFNFFKLRLCNKAQKEIKRMANQMFSILAKEHPLVFNLKNCGPACYSEGKCKELQPCLKI